MTKHLMRTTLNCLCAALLVAACGPTVNFTPDDPSDVRQPKPIEDVKLLEEGETPGPGYRTIGSIEVTAEVSCNTAMTQSKESAKGVIDEYVKSHMDLADSTSQEVVEAMVENGDLSKKQACKVLPIFAQIPEKEDILVAVLKGGNIGLLLEGTADAGGEGLYEVEHEVYKTRKKPALSGAGAVSPALVINVKSIGKVITLKEEEPEPEPEPEPVKKVAKKPKKKTEEVVVVKKSEPPPEDEEEEDEEETTVASAPKKETLVVEKTGPKKKEEKSAKAHKDEPWPPPDDEEEGDEDLDPKAAADKAKKEAEEAMLAVKEAKKKAKEAKLAAEKAEKEKKKAAMLKKKEETKAAAEAAKQAKQEAKLAKKKAAEEAAAKKKAEAEAKKKAKAEAAAKKKAEAAAKKKAEEEAKKKAKAEAEKKKEEEEGTELGKADKETINAAKNIIRGWKKEIFVCLHKSDKIESSGKVALMFFIDIEGQLDALSINPEPESGIKECIMKTVGDLDYPDVGVTYDFTMKYKVKPD